MTNYNDGKWWGWNGGECPVHPETVVSCVVLCSDGLSEGLGATKAKDYIWHNNHDSPIIAFRVIKEHKEPREFWIWPNGSDVLNKNPHIGGDHYIHVREVLE